MYEEFLKLHKPQLQACGVPELYWPTIFTKVTKDDFDSSNFQVLRIEYDGDSRQYGDPLATVRVVKEEGIDKNDPEHVYLIDHAWTFQIDLRKCELIRNRSLRERMSSLMLIDSVKEKDEIDVICGEMWKYCMNYSLSGMSTKVEDCMPVWYMMDELGSSITHSDDPNVRIVPFLYIPNCITYSLLFPIKNIANNVDITRDFIEGVSENLKRKALLHPWYPCDFRKESFVQQEPTAEYFLSGRIDETLPLVQAFPSIDSKPLKVFAEYSFIHEFLKNPNFVLCDDESSADILWYSKHFKNYGNLSLHRPNIFVNQFPFENVITIKDLLSVVCRRKTTQHHNQDTLETYPEWLPTTYNLETELIEFISYFQNRLDKGMDNNWICKPFNLARGLDTHVTNDLNCILRICRSGPKIAQKYIENPVLFSRLDLSIQVKFDIRYVVLLKSIKPLEVFIYNNFFLRFANKAFNLKDLDDYEKHFTVMNYNENATLCHMKCDEFKYEWAKQYPEHPYSDIEKTIKIMLREMFECATCKEAPMGIKSNPQSRALYAVDLMLSWNGNKITPKLLEVNWMPDCKRACEYYSDFYNDIFELLFLEKFDKSIFQQL